MGAPSAAIVVPTLNSAGTLAACLDAVARLDWPREDLDLIVVDGGSRDETLSLCRSHSVRLFVRSGRDAAYRRNFGAGQTDAALLLFVDPDCLVPRDFVRAAQRHLSLAQVAAVGVRGLPPHGPGSSWVQRTWAARGLTRVPDTRVRSLSGRMLAVRRAEFVAAGGFPENFGLLADRELLRRLAGGPARRHLIALTRADGLRLTVGRGLRDFYRAQRTLDEPPVSEAMRCGLLRLNAGEVALALYGLVSSFYLLAMLLSGFLRERLPGWELALALALASGPSLAMALRVALRSRRPLLLPPLWLLYLVRQMARGLALR